MAIAKVIEVIAESEHGWEDAAREAIKEASQSVRNVRSIYIKNMTAEVQDDTIVRYRVNANITFLVED
jgi:flavin-binding protein dodecin